jgi:hypothetical protein
MSPHCYYNQCFLDKIKAEAEKAEDASVECGRLAFALQQAEDVGSMHKIRAMSAAANTATAAAVNTVCISTLYQTDVLDVAERMQRDGNTMRSLAQSVGINTKKYDYGGVDFEDSKKTAVACVNSAIAAAKKAEAVTLKCIQTAGMQHKVKCNGVALLIDPSKQTRNWASTFAMSLVSMWLTATWQLFGM